MTAWTPSSWRGKPAVQQPVYPSESKLRAVTEQLAELPPLVTSWEVEALKAQLAEAAAGKRFLLQGGDCAERFEDCDATVIANKLKILLQMSLVLMHGSKKPVIRVGRFAGQYAKPRSDDYETRGERDAARLSRRSGQPPGVHDAGAASRSGTAAAGLRDGGADAQLHPRAGRRRASPICIIPSTGIWGSCSIRRWRPSISRWSSRIAESLRFMETLGGRRWTNCSRVDFFTSHEGLHLPYEQAQTRHGAAARRLVQPVDALPVDRHAHGGSGRRARRVSSAASAIRWR